MITANFVHIAGKPSLMSRFLKVLTPVDGVKPDGATMQRRTCDLLQQSQAAGTLEETVRQLLKFTGLHHILPAAHTRFQTVVVEGMVYLLSALPLDRLSEKIVDQLCLPMTASMGRRACILVKDMPTLQKLGQIICRNPGLDPEFRRALIDLEDNVDTVSYAELRPLLAHEIENISPDFRVRSESRILAEATVSAVIPAQVREAESGRTCAAVLKVVKPAVRQHIQAELALWDRLAVYLDHHREQWGLGELNFTGTLKEVRHLLEREVDLNSEQRNLDRVNDYFAADDSVVVPHKLEVSTPRMTAMSRVEGHKITDVAHLSNRHKRRLAAALVKTCILRPIQDTCPETLFHGDPHAGNLAYRFEDDQPRIIFYDWGMLGRLSRLERFALTLMALGLLAGNRKVVFFAADLLSAGQVSRTAAIRSRIEGVIGRLMENRQDTSQGVLGTIETLFEQLSYQGVVFPSNLSLYQKAMVTLKGVLADIDPAFDRDDYLIWESLSTFLNDLFRLRLHKLVLEEIWTVYRYSWSKFIELQRVLFRFLWEMGYAWARLP